MDLIGLLTWLLLTFCSVDGYPGPGYGHGGGGGGSRNRNKLPLFFQEGGCWMSEIKICSKIYYEFRIFVPDCCF